MKTPSIKYLRAKADRLYQLKLIRENPYSIVSGLPTQVIHHFVPKSLSNNLRYDWDNGVPLTNSEHFKHHTQGDSSIDNDIREAMGKEWYDDLQKRRREPVRINKGYLKGIIEGLK